MLAPEQSVEVSKGVQDMPLKKFLSFQASQVAVLEPTYHFAMNYTLELTVLLCIDLKTQ